MADDETDLPRGIALAWGIAADPQRGPKREMSVERIVDTAVALADAEGIGAVSMAAVAARLGFTPMSLYRYVSAKDDLLLLMQEHATGLPPEAHREQVGWRAKLESLYDAAVAVYLEHPWILTLPITGSPVTPNSSAWLDASLDALGETGLSPTERIGVALAVMGQARWCGIVFAGYTEQARATGLNAEQISQQESALFDRVITADEFPALRAAVDDGVFLDDSDTFRFGLHRLLEGVAAYVDERAAGAGPVPPVQWQSEDPPQVLADKKVREKRKALREAEKALHAARKEERLALREARARAAREGGA
ncbi:TetR/AcrR family transcriptional regulator [Microbacterium esteraromaticum]|uniref:TetR/AcrR family transcriptional regulator n=1 Tax=Microbacterium esteraromaticum TaxID=57043 RepID=A0A7D7WEI4_9MICO|nr:TetR/AcrR family transcriptional regulator [Microbacterium esteraromaticum]QMU97299.1 TetR/AcrR family transcriptional regulator [Microbacterium esteraromaticum]